MTTILLLQEMLKGLFFNEREYVITRNKQTNKQKSQKKKNLSGKGKHIGKVVGHHS